MIHLDAQPAIDASIFQDTGANPIAVSQAIHKKVDSIRPILPKGMQIKISYDEAIIFLR